MLEHVSSEDELLATYLHEVRELPVLSPSEERDLLTRGRNGDEAARKRVIEGYLELIAVLAIRLAPDWMGSIDAIQEGNVVLTRLVDEMSVARPAVRLTDALLAHFEGLER
jgi:DNA-directed RNA polymerase sigma subunit (sigma70/sigma32)